MTPKPDQRPCFVGIGGTGVIGSALSQVLAGRGIHYVSLSLSDDSRTATRTNIHLDLAHSDGAKLRTHLDTIAVRHRIVGIFDILGISGAPAQALSSFAQDHATPIAILSSCLLYDHDGSGPVDETAPLFTPDTAAFPYITKKLNLEAMWQRSDAPWLVLRTHHVLGPGSALGCLPGHNRDPNLSELMRAGAPLRLARSGDLRLSVIHPEDLTRGALELLTNTPLARVAVNLVHPTPVLARDYYAMISEQLQLPLPPLKDLSVDPADFWSMTAKNNCFTSRHPEIAMLDLRHDLRRMVSDALAMPPPPSAAFMQKRIHGGL